MNERRRQGPVDLARRSRPLVALVALALPCHPLGAQRPDVQVRDSGRVRIVENPLSVVVAPGRWVVEMEPAVEIGSVDGGETSILGGVHHGAVLADGRIVIANSAPIEVRVFTARGSHVRTFGRQGGAPGEFSDTITQLEGVDGNRIAVRNGHLSVDLFSHGGTYLGSVPGPVRTGLFDGSSVWLGGNRFLMGTTLGEVESPDASGVLRSQTLYAVWSSSDHRVDTLGVFLEQDRFRNDDTLPAVVVPFSGALEVATGHDLIAIGDGRDYRIRVFSPDRGLTHEIRKRYHPLPVKDAERTSARRKALEGPLADEELSPELRAGLEGQVESLPIPAEHPGFVDLVADEQGFLWALTPFHADGETALWDVFDQEGVLVATVEMPRLSRILEIGPEHVLAVWANEYDVEFVRLYLLRR